MKDDDLILKIGKDWRTAATDYPLEEHGTASITREDYKRGTYRMEAVDGYIFWYNHSRIPVTALCIHNKVVMVDDPLHWIGMQRLAEHATGNVLIIGLGLGLIAHHIVKNDKVTNVDIIEINPDVAHLISKNKLLPKDERLHLFVENGYEWTGSKPYDTVIVDILVSTDVPGEVIAAGFDDVLSPMGTWGYFKWKHPEAAVYIWGIRNEAVNPAVKNISRAFVTLEEMEDGPTI